MAELHVSKALTNASTRLTPPRLRDEFVLRADLVDRVLEPEARLVVISGPAGSGKSTLLAQSCNNWPSSVWLSIDASDNDPAVLWSALIDSAARAVPGFGAEYRHWLDAGGAAAVDATIARVVNELADMSHPVRFFLDDLHLLTDAEATDTLVDFIGRLPPMVGLVIASRAAAPFPLGRLRMQRTVVEIGPAELAMHGDEARVALVAAGVELDDAQLSALLARTEGWVAGLAWATMVLKVNPDATSFVDRVNSVDGDLATYLVEEVLERRSPELREFMLETSILTRFNVSLCNEVRGRVDSQSLIDELDRTNSFLVPLDRDGEWFRYHHLVHDVLATRIGRESPAVVSHLHLRAASWLRGNGDVAESIFHARAAGDHVGAADTLCANWWEMMNTGRMGTVHSLLAGFDHSEICEYQPLAIAAASIYSIIGDHQRGQVYFRVAEAGQFEGPPPDGSASIDAALAIMTGTVSFGGVDATLAAGKQASRLEPQGSKWRPLATLICAVGHIWRGELDEAEPLLDEAAVSGGTNDVLIMYALAELALIRIAQHDVDAAVSVAEAACLRSKQLGLDTIFVSALAHGAAATAHLAAGDLSAADRHLGDARVPLAGVSSAMPVDAMRTRLVLAEAAIRSGRLREARSYLDAADQTDLLIEDTGVLPFHSARVRERLDESTRASAVRLSERELAVLELMPGDLSLREIADTLYVSRETVKTHRRHIYRKLDVSSRTDAVVAARQLGLLTEPGDNSRRR